MVTHLFMQNKNFIQIFKWPIAVGVVTIFGLVGALLKDGIFENISMVGLSVPIIVIIFFYYRK